MYYYAFYPLVTPANGFEYGGVVTNPHREGGTGPKPKIKPHHRDPHWFVSSSISVSLNL